MTYIQDVMGSHEKSRDDWKDHPVMQAKGLVELQTFTYYYYYYYYYY